MADEESNKEHIPNLAIAQLAFLYTKTGEKSELLKEIEENQMTPYYEYLCAKHAWTPDVELLARMRDANAAELACLEAKRAIDEDDFPLAYFYARIGSDKANGVCEKIQKDTKSGGKRMDAAMLKMRLSLFYLKPEKIEMQGDWDRMNRLSVYEAIYCLVYRDLKRAGELFKNNLATFNSGICTYDDFLFYTSITNVSRKGEGPLSKALRDCEYSAFMNELIAVEPKLLSDRYLAPHARYIIREFRIQVYTQFLDAYKTVTLHTMASTFGVSIPFLDQELAHFISQGRLNAKIDKVNLVVETNRPDPKSAEYQTIIKHGDLLLNRIQQLARAVSI